MSTATFTRCIQPPWQHVRQPHGRNPVRGVVGALLWMLLYDLDTTNYTSNSLPTPRPPHFPLPAFHSTAPRPPSFHRLSPLAHGGEVRIVESVFAAGLLCQIRQRHLDLDALALHVATQEGTSTTKPAAMKLLTSKIFDFLISLRPTTTTDPASAATILQLQQQLAVAHSQLAQQAPSPSDSPTPTSSGKRPANPSQASLLDFGTKRPRLTTPDTPPPDVSPSPLALLTTPLLPGTAAPTHGGTPAAPEGALRPAPTPSPRLPMAHQQLPTRHIRRQSPAMDHFPEDQQRKQAGP